MNDSDLEARIARIMNDNVDQRLATVTRRPPTFDPGRPAGTGRRRARWMLPVLAAAAVAAVAVGAVTLVDDSHAHHHPTPPATTGPAPTGVPPAPAPSSATAPTTPPPTPTRPVGSQVPAGFTAADVSFVDPRLGWAIGNGACANDSQRKCPYVLRTQDGGARWLPLAAPHDVTPVDDAGNPDAASCQGNGNVYGPCVDRILFANATVGYLWSSRSLFMTVDGGSTWQDQHSHARDLAIANGHVLRFGPVQACSVACPGVLQVAPIGSSTWRVSNPGDYTSSTLSTLATGTNTAYFSSTRLSDGATAIYRSTDGGQTWIRSGPGFCGKYGGWIAAAPDETLSVTCYSAVGTSEVDISTDGGISFDRGNTPAGKTERADLVPASRTSVVAVTRVQDHPAFTILVSDNGGHTWTQTVGTGTPRDVVRAEFITANQGYILIGDATSLPGGGVQYPDDGIAVLITSDAGRTWTTHPFR